MPDRSLVLGLDSPFHYFNAGVLLFDSEALAELVTPDAVVEYALSHAALQPSLWQRGWQMSLGRLLEKCLGGSRGMIGSVLGRLLQGFGDPFGGTKSVRTAQQKHGYLC